MSDAPWRGPAECDRWVLKSFNVGHTLIRRREKWVATATGYMGDEVHVRYSYYGDTNMFTKCGHGHTREEAETAMRAVICADIKLYKDYIRSSELQYKEFTHKDVCPC